MFRRQLISQARAVMGILHGSRAFGGPLQANLSLTNRCNLRCIHCWFYSPLLEKPGMRSLRRAKQMGLEAPDREELRDLQRLDADNQWTNGFVDELLRMGTRRYQFSGNGEVFILKDSLELMAKAKHAGSYCVANTNGTLLEKDTADHLIKMGFDELRVTTMAGSPDVYERTHPGIRKGTFEKLTNHLRYLAERKSALKVKRPKVILVCVVVAQNCEGLVQFAEFAAQVKASGVQYKPVDDMGDPNLSPLVLSRAQADQVKAQLQEARGFLESRKIGHNIDHFLSAFQQKLDTTELYHKIPCFYGWLSVMAEADGTIYPCSRCCEPIGNVRGMEFGRVWDSVTYRRFRKEAISLNRRKSPVGGCDCYHCTHHAANLRVYQMLHPLERRSCRLTKLAAGGFGEDE